MFQRMRELAVQAISDSNTADDRSALNNEYKQLSAEVARIAENTQWNGTNILDGARTNSIFQIGANADQTIAVNFGDLSTNEVSVTPTDAHKTLGASQTITLSKAMSAGDVLSFKVEDALGNTSYATIKSADLTTGLANVPVTEKTSTDGAGALTGTIAATGLTSLAVPNDGTNNIKISDIVVTRGTHAPVAATDITSREFASQALGILDKGIEGVNSTRATLGASMSRLEYAADNLQNVSQNSSAARSRVLDADYASETTELARTQIIQQASTAMLSQANQAQQSVLSLLK